MPLLTARDRVQLLVNATGVAISTRPIPTWPTTSGRS